MIKLAEITSTSGPIVVEATESDMGTGQMSFSVRGATEAAVSTFEAAFQAVVSMARATSEQLTSSVVDADEIEIEFGVKFSSKIGFYVAAANAESSMRVKLKWIKPKVQTQSEPASH